MQLVSYLGNHHLLRATHSGFWQGHSTIRVLLDLLDADDRGDFAALVLLAVSSAFDTTDHDIFGRD